MEIKLNTNETLLKESLIHAQYAMQDEGLTGQVNQDNLPAILKSTSMKEAYFESLLEGYATSNALCENAGYAATSETFGSQVHTNNVTVAKALMENAANEVLLEHGMGSLRYYSTLTFPLIKRHMISCTAKNIIPLEVPEKPIFKQGMERLYVYDPKKPEKKFELQDIFYNNSDLTALDTALRTKKVEVITLTAGVAEVNLLTLISADKVTSTISRDFRVSGIEALVDTKTLKLPLNEAIVSGLNVAKISIDQQIVPTDDTAAKPLKATVFATLNFESGALTVMTSNPAITKVTVEYSISNENNFNSIAFDWGHTEKEFSIPDGNHFNISLPVEYTHDAKALYGMDMQAKLTEICGTFIEHRKDKEIYDYLDNSFKRLKHPFGIDAKFDLKPSPSYHGLPTEWANAMFKKRLSQIVGQLKDALHIKDCYFAVVGHPSDIKELKGDIKWVYSDGQMSGIKLDYKFGLMEDDEHNYTITSTRRIPQGTVRVYVIPTNNEQFTYKHFQYAFYVSNAYSNPVNPLLPNVMISDRYLTEEFTPVQAQIGIVNNDADIITRTTDNMFS
ncbi:MAG: hypothetical protein ACRC0G_07870 [Fusobacteriaceae bacterium]